jgi:hypothetical protein
VLFADVRLPPPEDKGGRKTLATTVGSQEGFAFFLSVGGSQGGGFGVRGLFSAPRFEEKRRAKNCEDSGPFPIQSKRA